VGNNLPSGVKVKSWFRLRRRALAGIVKGLQTEAFLAPEASPQTLTGTCSSPGLRTGQAGQRQKDGGGLAPASLAVRKRNAATGISA